MHDFAQFTLPRLLSLYICLCPKNAFLHYFPSSYKISDPITTGGKDTNCGINGAHIKGDYCSSMTINTETFFQGNISQKKRLKWFFQGHVKKRRKDIYGNQVGADQSLPTTWCIND